MIIAGIDIGSVYTKAVLLDGEEMLSFGILPTGADYESTSQKIIRKILEEKGIPSDRVEYVVTSGYGRRAVSCGNKVITELSAACLGAAWASRYHSGDLEKIGTIIDLGGQDTKVILLNDSGDMEDFLMNDKCAAGTGRGMEVFADLLSVSINDVGELSLTVEEEPEPVSSTCVVFAKSEAAGLLRKGWAKNKVLAAYCSAMAHRVVTLLDRIGMENDFAITGGIAKNKGIVTRIEKELGVKALEPKYDTQIAGALGAALFARALILKSKKN